jgi:hypothetical protein
MTIEYGNINYDVPQERRTAYSKLRALFRRSAIMQTYSSYLIPWGKAKEIRDGIDRINCDSDGLPLPTHLHVRYSIFKYDEKESGKALEQSAHDALMRMMRSMKEKLNTKVQALFTEEDLEDGKDPVASAKVAARKLTNTVRDARALALMFNLTDNLDAAFLGYEAWIEAKKAEIKDYEEAAKVVVDIEEDSNTLLFDDPGSGGILLRHNLWGG